MKDDFPATHQTELLDSIFMTQWFAQLYFPQGCNLICCDDKCIRKQLCYRMCLFFCQTQRSCPRRFPGQSKFVDGRTCGFKRYLQTLQQFTPVNRAGTQYKRRVIRAIFQNIIVICRFVILTLCYKKYNMRALCSTNLS